MVKSVFLKNDLPAELFKVEVRCNFGFVAKNVSANVQKTLVLRIKCVYIKCLCNLKTAGIYRYSPQTVPKNGIFFTRKVEGARAIE